MLYSQTTTRMLVHPAIQLQHPSLVHYEDMSIGYKSLYNALGQYGIPRHHGSERGEMGSKRGKHVTRYKARSCRDLSLPVVFDIFREEMAVYKIMLDREV